MIDIDTWSDMQQKENIKNEFDSMVDNNKSYLGKTIFNIVKKFINIKIIGYFSVTELDILNDFYLKDGKYTKYPISDNGYYFLFKRANGEIGIKRDLVKSPKMQ
jgi:hypothetical protein